MANIVSCAWSGITTKLSGGSRGAHGALTSPRPTATRLQVRLDGEVVPPARILHEIEDTAIGRLPFLTLDRRLAVPDQCPHEGEERLAVVNGIRAKWSSRFQRFSVGRAPVLNVSPSANTRRQR